MKLFQDCLQAEIEGYLSKIGMRLQVVADDDEIPGSFWGESEAGLIKDVLYVRKDTPFHSLLHESGHYICMTQARRDSLHTNAIGKTKGDYSEEDAVCYLQLLLANYFSFYSRDELFADMDAWGYSFRLGAARKWFEQDAQDAFAWLQDKNLLSKGAYNFSLRK